MWKSLSTVFLIGRDLAASRRFYSEILGLEEAGADSEHVRYRLGGVQLIIHAPIRDEEMRAWNLEPLTDPRGSGVILTLESEDADAAHAALARRGAEVLFPPRDAPWGVRLFLVRDPSGFTIEVSQPR